MFRVACYMERRVFGCRRWARPLEFRGVHTLRRSSTEAFCEHLARAEDAAAAAGQPDTLQRLLEFAGACAPLRLDRCTVDTLAGFG